MAALGHPHPSDILEARKRLGITQTEAAAMLHTTCRVWQQWEAGKRKMHPAFWELFRIKALLNERNMKFVG
jgi:DNA-binding transcriptional regulator YiaG